MGANRMCHRPSILDIRGKSHRVAKMPWCCSLFHLATNWNAVTEQRSRKPEGIDRFWVWRHQRCVLLFDNQDPMRTPAQVISLEFRRVALKNIIAADNTWPTAWVPDPWRRSVLLSGLAGTNHGRLLCKNIEVRILLLGHGDHYHSAMQK